MVANRIGLLLGIFFYLWGGNAALAAKNHLLTPPWELLQAKLSAVLKADPCVTVDPLTGQDLDMEIRIWVCNDQKAQALAAFLNKRHEFGDYLAVNVLVYAPNSVSVEASLPESIDDTARLLSLALAGNKYFIKTGIGTGPMAHPAAYAVFQPAVVQYYADDMSDWYKNTNEVAAKVFSDVFNLHPFEDGAVNIFATTIPMFKK